MGGLVGGQTKLDMNKDGMITKQDFKMMPKNKKMGGGKVYKYKKGTGNKTIKGNMSGEELVRRCYSNPTKKA